MPVLAEVKVTANWPFALVVPVNGPAGLAAAPLLLVRVTVTVSPAAATKVPVAGVLLRVTVKVWGWPISLVALGAIEILASTQVLTAGPELAPTPSVDRVSTMPPGFVVKLVCAETVVTPVTADVIDTEQEPVPPAVRQESTPPTKEPGPESMV